ncbi:hypothetical protein RchiOBHm_Chr4g0445921 [Rosa chinensis]|uniref:Uncharacterized protein n=1 Tax=Rosa chinensis TaxID=74649 RepID=A0A2P6R4H7_ROSCH|nr:hypothetical protein RchiOBHm_Chr4g0445921 [Rosa chinensis]
MDESHITANHTPLPHPVSIPEDGDLPLRSPIRRAVSGSRYRSGLRFDRYE